MAACGYTVSQPTVISAIAREAPEATLTETPSILNATASPTIPPPTKSSPSWPTVTPFMNEVTFEIIGQLGGPASAVAVKDRMVYLGVGPQVLILDASDPATPRQIGQSGAFLDFVQDIVAVGDLVYVATGNAGLHIMDLTKPLKPRQIGIIPNDGSFEQVIIQGDMAFIAESLGEYSNHQDVVRLFDVSDPGSPREFNRLDGRLLDVQEDKVYVIQNETLRVIDISGSKPPLEFIDTGLNNASAISGQYVYTVGASSNTLGIVDLSDPHNPKPRGSLKLGDDFIGQIDGMIKVNANLIYVKSTFWGESGYVSSALSLVNVSNPDYPRKISAWFGQDEPTDGLAIPGALADEMLEDNFLYLALGSTYSSNGLWIVDMSDLSNLHKVGSFSALASALNAVSVDGFAYALRFGFPNDLTIVDLAKMDNIQNLWIVPDVGVTLDELVLMDHYLYLPGSQGTILDLANPTSPLEMDKSVSGLENSSNIKIAGEHACVSNFNGGLSFFDLSDPAQPRLVGHLDTENISYLVCSDTEAFYVTTNYLDDVTALHIADISYLTQPNEVVSQSLLVDYVHDIAYGNGYLYVTASQGYVPSYHEQLLVFDVSNKAHPRQVNTVEIGSGYSKISIIDNYAYLAGEDITVFDISDPVYPRPVGKMEIPGGAYRITVFKQDTLLVTAGGGILILRIYGLRQPTVANYCPSTVVLMSVHDR